MANTAQALMRLEAFYRNHGHCIGKSFFKDDVVYFYVQSPDGLKRWLTSVDKRNVVTEILDSEELKKILGKDFENLLKDTFTGDNKWRSPL